MTANNQDVHDVKKLLYGDRNVTSSSKPSGRSTSKKGKKKAGGKKEGTAGGKKRDSEVSDKIQKKQDRDL